MKQSRLKVTLGCFTPLLLLVLSGCGSVTKSSSPQTSPQAPQISVTPSNLLFSDVAMGESVTQSLKVSNTGSATLSITAANIAGPGFDTGQLSLPMTIAAGGSGAIHVVFTPANSGSVTGSLSLATNVPTSPTVVVDLSGTGVARSTTGLTAAPTMVNFGNVNVGSTVSQTITVTNSGTSTVTISQVSASGAGFSSSGVTSAQALTTGQSIKLTVDFAPSSAGSVAGNISIASTAMNSPTEISLTGTGVVQVSSGMGQTVPQEFFGMHVGVGSSYSTAILPPIVIGAVGKGVDTAWPYLEQSRGNYWWEPLDEQVSFGASHDAPVFISHEDEPAWAVSDTSTCFTVALNVLKCPAAPSDLTKSAACEGSLTGTTTTDCMWKEFLTTLVNRYKSTGIQTGCTSGNPQCHGVIQMYEGWNEPPGSSPMSNSDFVTLETDFLNTVRANDPNAQVCSPAFIMWQKSSFYEDVMTSYFQAGLPTTWDCYDFHINEPTPEEQIADINEFKTILTNNGIDPTTHTIYATEAGGWGECGVAISGMTEQAYIARIELLYWSNGVKRHYWYAYDSCRTLTNQPTSQTLNAAGIGYGNVEKWMTGATMSGPCAANGAVWTCGLTRSNGYEALAVWDTSGTGTFVVPSGYTQYQDLDGNTHSLESSVAIGTEPILLTNGVAAE